MYYSTYYVKFIVVVSNVRMCPFLKKYTGPFINASVFGLTASEMATAKDLIIALPEKESSWGTRVSQR